MPGSWPPHEFPGLTQATCSVTSRVTSTYNCIAWAAKNDSRWWWPDTMGIAYWPLPQRELTVECFVKAFETLGYKICLNDSLEDEVEKIAIYGHKPLNADAVPTHAALQLSNGEWTSKLGSFEDIVHPKVDAVNGPLYGRPLVFMSRPRQGS